MAGVARPSWSQLKTKLAGLDKPELLDLVKDLFDLSPATGPSWLPGSLPRRARRLPWKSIGNVSSTSSIRSGVSAS